MLTWPPLAGDMRLPLFVDDIVPVDVASALQERGWDVVDVRTLADPAKALKGRLDGVRQGSIQADQTALKFMELEARTLGLVGTKDQVRTDAPKPEGVEALLSSLSGTMDSYTARTPVVIQKATGRQTGTPDSGPRDKSGYKNLRGAPLKKKIEYLERIGHHETALKLKRRAAKMPNNGGLGPLTDVAAEPEEEIP